MQICTELLYQPLTLLDCLHTFCGSCLKEWFSFQAVTIEKAPTPPTPDAVLFTCPSCRAKVRDTRHNATVVTLLDMFVTAHPDKARSAKDKEDMAAKYKPGDQVLPKITTRERTAEEREADEEDRRLVDEVRELSLREASGASGLPPGSRRPSDGRSRSSGEPSSDSRRRRAADGGRRTRRDVTSRRSADQLSPGDGGGRRRERRSESRQRQVEHQSSLRSLISSADMSERDIEREIEDFARQIQEEGLLEGLDLDNIDLSRDDELSRRITEAYRRRQRGRSHQQRTRRRSNASGHSGQSGHSGRSGSQRPADGSSQPESRPTAAARRESRSGSRVHSHSRSASANRAMEDRSRPPPAMSATLDVRDTASRPRRRTGSGSSRSTTAPVSYNPPSASDNRSFDSQQPAARSQTDLPLRTQAAESGNLRPGISEVRSSSTPNVPAASPPPQELPTSTTTNLASFASRVPYANPTLSRDPSPAQAQPPQTQTPSTPPEQTTVSDAPIAYKPAELAVVHSAVTTPASSSSSKSGHQRTRSQLYPEPSITCSSCRRSHIEYELHYNCYICADGQWNICLDCYRAGKGCLYWFGFGYGAWRRWDTYRQNNDGKIAMPHMLKACRYTPPQSTPGGADGRKTLTREDPKHRLESGTFCCRCFVWTNECYWRCDVCNDGDWGFCNNCVNQGKSCTHMLLPLTHETTETTNGRPLTPRSSGRPPAAAIFTGPTASSIGPFQPLTFNTRCDLCQEKILPTEPRYHCYECTSQLVAGAAAGDYDICFSCYANTVAHGEISVENGYAGWRRCLNGHRMVIVGFVEGQIGQWRYVDRDMVGGRALRAEPYENAEHQGKGLQKWAWVQGDQKFERLVTKDVKETAPTSDGSTTFSDSFPPDGGVGARGVAKWPWYPKAGVDDELMFPRGAEVTEIEDQNGEWSHGTFMGSKGLFPTKYVPIMEQNA